jgi:alpha-glucosidase
VQSPDKRNTIEVNVAAEQIEINILRDEVLRVGPVSPYIILSPKVYERKFIGCKEFSTEGIIKTPVYKKSQISLASNRSMLSFSDGLNIELCARDDALAYRFVFDDSRHDKSTLRVLDEDASLRFPNKGEEFWIANEWRNARTKKDVFQNSWEFPHTKRELADVGVTNIVCLPLLVQYQDGVVMSITESDLRDYPGLNFRREKDSDCLKSAFAKMPVLETCKNDRTHIWIEERLNFLTEVRSSRTFPWRVFMLAENPSKLCENDAVYALAKPSEGDFSWVVPGLSAWDWWNDSVVRENVDFKPGMNTPTLKHYIDFSAEYSLPYFLVDAGWAYKDNLRTTVKDLDLEEVCKYAKQKGVKIILWAGWGSFYPDGQDIREEIFKKYSEMGVSGFKIDFIDRDDAYAERFFEETAKLASKYRLVLNYHGMHKPTGLHRTYPNILNYEGVFGLEQVKWSVPGVDFAKTDLSVFYCRMSAGPLDYTPGAMRNATRKTFRPSYSTPESMTTRVHQLSLYVMYDSPLQMMCDSPSMYRENEECARFISEIPTTWDETIGLEGDMDRYALIARRKGDVWYVAAIGPRQPFSVDVQLDFLSDGVWQADIFEDGPLASAKDASDYKHKRATYCRGSTLKINMAGGGGYVARLVRRK